MGGIGMPPYGILADKGFVHLSAGLPAGMCCLVSSAVSVLPIKVEHGGRIAL